MRKTLFVILLIIVNTGTIIPQALAPNFRVHPSLNNQIEPTIVVHQTNPQIMFASAFTVRQQFFSEGIYVTTNGGLIWFGTDTNSGTLITNHGGDPGPIIDKNGRFIITHRGYIVDGLYSNYSDNMGATWSANYQIVSYTGGDIDKSRSGTNNIPSSSFYGRTYLVWTRFTTPFPIVISYTDNGAQTWTSQLQINNTPGGHISYGPQISVGPSGQVYVSWAAAISISPFNEDFIGFAVSTNGGSSWTVTENAYDCNGIKTSSLQPWGIRVNGYPYMDVDKTGGARNGWIYIVEAEKNLPPAGSDPDIVFHRSTNGGQSWSPGIRVNQDALNNGKAQFLPALEVDDGGGVNVIYFDNGATSNDSLVCIYLSRSIDGGYTWSYYRVSDHLFRPAGVQGQGSNQGDHIGITSSNGKLFPLWMDNSSGIYQIWTAIIDINSIGVKQIGSEIPKEFKLGQNYPNPFNSSSKFKVQSSKLSKVKVIIYDMTGKEVTILVDQELKPGIYEVKWDAANYPSGVYFYRLITNDYTETKKMVLMK